MTAEVLVVLHDEDRTVITVEHGSGGDGGAGEMDRPDVELVLELAPGVRVALPPHAERWLDNLKEDVAATARRALGI